MSENVVDLAKRKYKDIMHGVAIIVVGHAFEIDGCTYRLSRSWEIGNGDYATVIDEIRKAGGLYMQRERGDCVEWFLPWSGIAAIRILHLEQNDCCSSDTSQRHRDLSSFVALSSPMALSRLSTAT